MKLFIFVDKPWTPMHILWHFTMCVCMLVDAVLGVATLGFRHPSISQWFVEGGGNLLFNHEKEAQKDWERNRDTMKRAIAEELGLDPDNMVELTEENAELLMKQALENEMFKATKDEETFN